MLLSCLLCELALRQRLVHESASILCELFFFFLRLDGMVISLLLLTSQEKRCILNFLFIIGEYLQKPVKASTLPDTVDITKRASAMFVLYAVKSKCSPGEIINYLKRNHPQREAHIRLNLLKHANVL